MSYAEETVLDVLRKYASDPTARGMLRRAKEEIRLDGEQIPEERFSSLRHALDVGIKVFFDARHQESAIEDLRRLERERDLPAPVEVPLVDEHDARRARMLLRHMCQECGATAGAAMRAAQRLSEITAAIARHGYDLVLRITLDQGPPLAVHLALVEAETGKERQRHTLALEQAEDPGARETG